MTNYKNSAALAARRQMGFAPGKQDWGKRQAPPEFCSTTARAMEAISYLMEILPIRWWEEGGTASEEDRTQYLDLFRRTTIFANACRHQWEVMQPAPGTDALSK